MIAESRRNAFWFGTEEKMMWLPTPNRGAQTGGSGWAAEGTTLNGGGFQLNSFGSHRQYIFEWPNTSSAKMAQTMKSYADGSFGRGLVYFLDPLIYTTNVLPAMWADPSMGIGQEGASLVYGVEASGLPTSDNPNDLPVKSAYYDLGSIADGWRGKEDAVFIPVPEGYTFSFGSIHSQTGQGRVLYRTQSRTGALGAVTAVTPLLENTSQLVNTFVSGPDLAGVWLFVGKIGAGAGSVTLTAMTGRLIPTVKSTIAPVATNLFTNPRLVGDGTWAEVRRNLVRRPRGTASHTGNWSTLTTRTTEMTGGPDHCPQWGKGVVLSATSAVAYQSAVGGVTATPVTGAFEAGYSAFSSRGGTSRAAIFFYNAAGSFLEVNSVALPNVTLPAGQWVTRTAWIASPPAGAARALMEIYVASAYVPGDVVGFTATHISNTPGGYFDGSTTPETAVGVAQPEDFQWRWLGEPNESESVMEIERVATKIGDSGPVYLEGAASKVWPEGGTSLRVFGDVPVRVGDQLDPYEPVPLPGVQVSAIPLGDPTTPAWLAGISSGVLWDTGKIRWTAGQPEAQDSYGAVLRTTGGTNPVSLYGSFRFTGTRFALMMTSWAETDVTVYVDHRAVTPTAYPTLTQGTGYQLVVFEGFGGGVHTVDFCIGWASNFVQILCEQPESVEPGPQPAFRLGLLGDSYADSGIQPYYGGLARELHRLTGWSIYQLGQGSTGYTNDGSSSGDPSKSVYGSPSRVAAANGSACDAVLIIGSVNDGAASPATVAQACADLVDELHAPVIIAGVEPLSLPDDPGTAWNAVNDMLMGTASSLVTVAGGGVIDWRAESWLTGTGSVSQPRGDGNQDLYIGDVAGTDTVHANIEGQMFLAERFVAAMTPMTLVRRGVDDGEYALFPGAITGHTLVLRAESPSQFAITIGDEAERLHPDGDGIVRASDAGMVLLSAGRWTDIGVFAGTYDGPAFNGSSGIISIGSQLAMTEWDGTPDNSTSTAYSASTELINIRKGPWIGGQGHSGCRFIGKPTEIKYGPFNGGQVGFAASFREVGSWLYG